MALVAVGLVAVIAIVVAVVATRGRINGSGPTASNDNRGASHGPSWLQSSDKCSVTSLNCSQFSTEGRIGMKLHELVFAARSAGRSAEAICLAQSNTASSDGWLAGATHFEVSNAWEAMGCHELAVKEVEASLQVRPRGRSGWKETCDWCKQLKGTCGLCSTPPGPSLRSVDWASYYRRREEPNTEFHVHVDEVLYGNLGVDANEQAVVRISDPGTKGQTLEIYTLRDGQPAKVGAIDGGWRSDGGLETVAVRDRAIWIERSELAPGECMACSSIIQSERWFWADGKIQEDTTRRSRRKR